MEYIYFVGRITICFILGATIGLERHFRRKIAGIRTITLVAVGAFLFVSVSRLTTGNDITRIAAQVVSGIGFLGAGVILRDGVNVKGLNTAATLWCSAAIGVLTALGFIVEAFIGVFYILLSNMFLRLISKKLTERSSVNVLKYYKLVVKCVSDKELIIKNMLIQKFNKNKKVIKRFSYSCTDSIVEMQIELEIGRGNYFVDNIVNKLCAESGVILVEYNEIEKYLGADDDYDDK